MPKGASKTVRYPGTKSVNDCRLPSFKPKRSAAGNTPQYRPGARPHLRCVDGLRLAFMGRLTESMERCPSIFPERRI